MRAMIDAPKEEDMRRAMVLGVAVLSATSLSCGRPTEGPSTGRLQVFVHWENDALADRRLEIVELGAVRVTDRRGMAEFVLPPGTFTLRAYVNAGGPVGHRDASVNVTEGRTIRVEVIDCLPCMSPT
jgi:hypothetical protein